jgi:hypothetical protein
MFNEVNSIHPARDKIKQRAVANTMTKFRFSHFLADGMTAAQELELCSYQSGNGLCSWRIRAAIFFCTFSTK